MSIRGICTDERGVAHTINKELVIGKERERRIFSGKIYSGLFFSVAIERKLAEANDAVDAHIFKVGHVQLFQRNRNLLNFIIIPISVGLTLLLIVITFVLRRLRFVHVNDPIYLISLRRFI